MKQKIFTLLLALITTMSLLAIGRNDGSNMANAIDYDWDNGTMHYSGTRWYYMDLAPLYEGADSLHFHITNLSNTESVDVIYKMTIAGQMDSISLTLAPHGVYTSPNMDANMLVRMHLTHLYFTVSSMGNVQLNWQLVFPSGDSCEESKHGGGFQEAGTKWYDIKAPDRDENEVMEYNLSISFLNIDEDYHDNDISNTISLNFKTDCNSPAFYDTTFTIDPGREESVLLYDDQLAALGWPDLLFSCTSSTSCRIEHTYYSYVPGESCFESIHLNWEPVEQSADLNRWYALHTHDGDFNPIIPDTCDLRIKINNLSDETANVNADVYFECREEERISQKSYVLEPYGSEYLDINRDFLERFVWPPILLDISSNQNISIQAELIPNMPRDTMRDTIVAYVCQGIWFVDTITGIGYDIESSMTWTDTIDFQDGLQIKDSIITFYIHPLVMPEPLSAEEMRGIGAVPLLVQGMQLFVDESNAGLMEYYRNLGNSVDTITHIDTAYWAKPVYKANGDLDSKKEAPLDLSKYYSKNEYMDTLLLVVKSEECDFIMRIEYIFPIEEYKYVFRNDTICPPDPYYNPDTLTSIVLDTLGLPRMVDTITIYYSMLQPALYSQDEISLLPVVANGQPIDTVFTIYALKQQFANDATDLTARVTNIKWQVLEGDVWMDMPYVVSQTATEMHMRYIVETECGVRDTSMNIILPLTPEPCLIASGTCGNNLTWTLTCDSVLTISGTGDMTDYDWYAGTPWYSVSESIKSIKIEDGVTSIGSSAFSNCFSLTTITIPNSVTSIGNNTFDGCTNMTSVEIGNNVSSIGTLAFRDCRSLTSITIPNSVTYIGYWTFNGCTGLTTIEIPNSVTNIGDGPFSECTNLSSIIAAVDNTKYCTIDGVLFSNDKTKIVQYPGAKQGAYTIPHSVTRIGGGAFYGCAGLTSVDVHNSITSIGNSAFRNCSGLTSIEIPNSVTNIGNAAFENCTGLTSITIPNSVTYIEVSAFENCTGLTSITIHNAVTILSQWAFSRCTGLTSFKNYATTPQTINADVFRTVNLSACTLYVPAESLAAYQAADVWKDFGNILPIEGDLPVGPTEGEFNVLYITQDGDSISSEAVMLHLPVAPEIAGFTFLKWQVVAGDLENGIIIQAVYQANEYTSAPEVYTNPANPAQKLIRNGNVYILTDDKIYSITGQTVR